MPRAKEPDAGWSNILFRREWAEIILKLPDDLRLKVCDAIFNYILTGEDPKEASILYSPYFSIRTTIENDKKSYQQKIVDRNRNNGQNGGRPPKEQEENQKPKKPIGLNETQKTRRGKGKEEEEEKEDEFSNENIIPPNPLKGDIPPSGHTRREKKRFQKPTLEEVREYIAQKGLDMNLEDAEEFYDHYETNGWVTNGGNPIKNWEAAVRNWNRRKKRYGRDRKYNQESSSQANINEAEALQYAKMADTLNR